ncbi:DUF5694 domain-containing protein [Novosphingobium huizhouense]|uniref:DUF5694 domain-containing protein n=1 Tax=Novosphingobium huizhouense TaxID=2866625 RepID=UPI001CD828E5|nr:DUF5694 domain-containing protein [Novosphingobium huizhouense]
MAISEILLAAAAALAQPPAPAHEVNPPTPVARAVWLADAAVREPKTEVLVLGTPHLSMLPPDFDRALLEPLLVRLQAWRPRMIMVEAVGGAQCDYLRTFAAFYPGTAEDYCPDAGAARTALKLDQAGAEAEIARLLEDGRADRPAAERRRLAALFLAAGDPASARVQWLRLPASERIASDGLTDALLGVIAAVGKRPNENREVAAELAARLGLERVWPVDDHTGDRAAGPSSAEQEATIQALWNNVWSSEHKAVLDKVPAQLREGAVLSVYRDQNSPAAARYAVASDFAATAADSSPERHGRRYLAYWETRNLRMVANMREAMGPTPGTRVLAIVGSSHKPYYERYLGVLSEIHVASTDEVLAEKAR